MELTSWVWTLLLFIELLKALRTMWWVLHSWARWRWKAIRRRCLIEGWMWCWIWRWVLVSLAPSLQVSIWVSWPRPSSSSPSTCHGSDRLNEGFLLPLPQICSAKSSFFGCSTHESLSPTRKQSSGSKSRSLHFSLAIHTRRAP